MHQSDAYWEWVADLPPEYKDEEAFKEAMSYDNCEERYDYDKCKGCPEKEYCSLRERFVERNRELGQQQRRLNERDTKQSDREAEAGGDLTEGGEATVGAFEKEVL